MRKLILWTLLGAAVVLATVLIVRTLRLETDAAHEASASDLAIDPEGAATRLAGSLRFQTVSFDDPRQNQAEPFLALHDYLAAAFPLVHAALERETVAELSLLYQWPGRDPDLPPVVLMAHQDVVPVEETSRRDWSFAPFAGEVVNGFIQGRGALDDKSGLVGILEAVELLLREGFTPQRTVFLAFGHDEEIGGWDGAKSVADLLAKRGVRPELVLDEGGVIAQRLLPGLTSPVALIGIAEKGHVNIELRVGVAGGHSSVQQDSTAIGVLSRAIARIEDSPLRARLELPSRKMLLAIAPRLPFSRRLVTANLWLFEPLVTRGLAAGASAAMVRTTVAPTMIEAGVKPNVLPTEARAVINVRILTGSTAEGVLTALESIVDDQRVAMRTVGRYSDPSPVASVETAAFEMIEKSILQAARMDDLVVAPFLMIGGTDSKHFVEVAENVYRFLGVKITPESLPTVHGIDERISLEDYVRIIRIYGQILRNVDQL